MLMLIELLIRGDLRHFWRQKKTLPTVLDNGAVLLFWFRSLPTLFNQLFSIYPTLICYKNVYFETSYVTFNYVIDFCYKKYIVS